MLPVISARLPVRNCNGTLNPRLARSITLIISRAVAQLKYATLGLICGHCALQIESKKLDFKDKAKPKTDSGVHDAAAEASASATVTDEHPPGNGTSEEVLESQGNSHGEPSNK